MLAQALRVLLSRAGLDIAACEALSQEIASQEQAELLRAHGRIASRKRFKGQSSQPILENRPVLNLFLDESGKSFPEPALTGASYFALGGIAISDLEVKMYCERADAIKAEFFGRTDITFHEPSMRNRDGIYYFSGDAIRQQAFDAAIERLIHETDFLAFGVGVRKHAFEDEFVKSGIDPYLPTDTYAVAITMLLERFVDCLAMSPVRQMGRLTFESQGPLEDAHHQLEYARVLLEGSQWVPDSAFRQWLETGLRFTPKHGSDPTELSDMLSRDLFEWTRSSCTSTPKYWKLFGGKMYCRGDGRMGKFGIKVFPDADIRQNVEQHRILCGAES